MTIPTWAHEKKFCRFKDPINVIFEGATLQEILRELDNENWIDPKILGITIGSDLFLREDSSCDHRQDAQRVRDGKVVKRFHVRLWEIADSVVAGAHYEELSGIQHKVHSFETGKTEVERAFAGKALWNVDTEDLRNLTDYPEHDGHASKIWK